MPATWGRESPASPPYNPRPPITQDPKPLPPLTTDDYMPSKVQYVNNDILTDCVLAKDFKVCNPTLNPK